MESIRHTFFIRALWAFALMVFAAGCSTGGDGDGSFFGGDIVNTAGPSTGTVVINQQFLPRALPSEVARQRFLGFNASDVLVYGPVLKDRAPSVTLQDVPVTVTSLQMQLLDSNGVIIGIGTFPVTVVEGETTVVDDPPFSDIAEVLTDLQVTPAAPTIVAGTSQEFTATGLFADGSQTDLSSSVAWTSSNTSVATVDSKGKATATTPGSTAVTASVGQVSGTATLNVSPATILSIQISGPSNSLANGTSQQYTAIATLSDNTTQEVTGDADWSSSNTGVATVQTSGETSPGEVTGLGAGETTITAALNSVSGGAVLVVTSGTVTSISLTPSNQTLPAGASSQYKAVATFSDGSQQDVTSAAMWGVTNSSAASVQTTDQVSPGLVTTDNTGANLTTKVQATFGGQTGETDLTVSNATVVSVLVTPELSVLADGTKAQLTATAVYSNDTTDDVTDQASWSSGAVGVADVVGGEVTAVDPGEADVTATFSSVSGIATVVVTDATATSISVSPADQTLAAGLSAQYTAVGTFSDGSEQDITSSASWTVTNSAAASIQTTGQTNPGLATSDQNGANLSSKIQATFGGQTGEANLDVSTATVVSIDITPSLVVLADGTLQQLTATATYSDNTTDDVTDMALWSSADNSVATIETFGDSTPGQVTATDPGETTITATFGSVSGEIDLVVTDATLTELVVSDGSSVLPLGAGTEFLATGIFSDGSTQDLTSSAAWQSSDSSVAIVSKGVVTTLATGETDISATLLGKTSNAVSLEVTDAELESITVTASTYAIAAGNEINFSAQGEYTDGSTPDITDMVTWSSSVSGVATIDADGKATGVSAGETSIEAELDGITGAATLYVSNAVPTGLTISGGAASIADGTTTSYTLTIDYSDGTSLVQTSAATWSSSDDAFASVQSPGVLRGESPTTTDVTVTAEYLGLQTTTSLEVTSAVIESIEVTGDTTLYTCLTYECLATATYTNGDAQDVTKSVVWSSSYTPVATVSNDTDTEGVVSPVAGGQTTISATLVNSLGETLVADLTATVEDVPDMILSNRIFRFDTDTGVWDGGSVHEGWDSTTKTLTVGCLEIPSGGWMIVSGDSDFSLRAVAKVSIDGRLEFNGSTGGEAGGIIYLSSEGELLVSSTGRISTNGADGSGNISASKSGGDGGQIALLSDGNLVLEGTVECFGGEANSNSDPEDNGQAGTVTLSSAGDLGVAETGKISCNGTDGFGTGTPNRGTDAGRVDLMAGGTLTFSGTIQCSGGDGGDGGAGDGVVGSDAEQAGSGGEVVLDGLALIVDGIIKVSGGRGGDGFDNDNAGGDMDGTDGASGGSAGNITLSHTLPITSTGGTFEAVGGRGGNGGDGGTRNGSDTNGGNGANGGNGGNLFSDWSPAVFLSSGGAAGSGGRANGNGTAGSGGTSGSDGTQITP